MSGMKRYELKLTGVVLAILLGSCNPTSLDDGSSADSILEVLNIPTIPPVTSAVDATATPPTCTFTVTAMTVTLQNRAKNELAGQTAFNDIIMENVTLTYTWDDPSLVTPPRTLSLGGTVPAGGSGSVSFPPLALGDLQSSYGGHSVNIAMLFRGRTVAGETVTAPGGAVLSVNACAGGGSGTCAAGSDDDADGLCEPNDACPNCNNPSCQLTGCGTTFVCGNPGGNCSGAFDPPGACANGSDGDGDGLQCPNDRCPGCNDVACTDNLGFPSTDCAGGANCTNPGATCP